MCTEWTFGNCWVSPRGGTVHRKRRLLGHFQRENQEQLLGIATGLRKDYVVIRELRWSAPVAHREHTPAGCSKSSSSKTATSEGPRRYTPHFVWAFAPRRILANGKAPPVLPISEKLLLNVEDLNDARTPLADIFSILLEEIADQLHRLFRRGGGMDEMRRELREQTHPGIVGTQQNHSFLCLQRQRNF